MGLMRDLFGTKKRKKKGRRHSAWIEDGAHRHKSRAKKRAKKLRELHYKTRMAKLPNGMHVVFKKHR